MARRDLGDDRASSRGSRMRPNRPDCRDREGSLRTRNRPALDPAAEPTDHNIPLVKQREALPDYELSLIGDDGDARYLGVKPDESAAAGLTWKLDDPVSISQIATVRLREKDKIVSDALAEVHISGPSVESNGYRFEFKTERSVSVGVHAFFATPIGIAIVAAFGIAVLLIILANFSV